jgi:RNA-directed DNA polymerase
MEQAIRSRIRKRRDQVNFIRYADDFVVTARHKETLEQIVKPTVVDFLAQRGLELSEQKTTITHIETGFNFLGQNVRKYKNKLVIRPAKEGLKALVQKSRDCIKGCVGQTAQTLIAKLNPIIQRMGQLSPLRLLAQNLLERGPCGPLSTVTMGQADTSE